MINLDWSRLRFWPDTIRTSHTVLPKKYIPTRDEDDEPLPKWVKVKTLIPYVLYWEEGRPRTYIHKTPSSTFWKENRTTKHEILSKLGR